MIVPNVNPGPKTLPLRLVHLCNLQETKQTKRNDQDPPHHHCEYEKLFGPSEDKALQACQVEDATYSHYMGIQHNSKTEYWDELRGIEKLTSSFSYKTEKVEPPG